MEPMQRFDNIIEFNSLTIKERTHEIDRKKIAKEFIVAHTLKKNQRLISKVRKFDLYREYCDETQNPLCKNKFLEVYQDLRVLRDKHCKYDVYSCPQCDDQFPLAKSLLDVIDVNSEDYKTLKTIYDSLIQHKGIFLISLNYYNLLIDVERKNIQTEAFYKLWSNPPENGIVIAEDAGKRFVLGIFFFFFEITITLY